MFLFTVIITVGIMLFFGWRPGAFFPTYSIYIDFPAAPGVAPKTRIFKSGIPIGRVTSVKLKDEGGVRVTAEIDADQKIFKDEMPWLTRSLLTSDAEIEFSRDAKDTSRPAAHPDGRPTDASPPADRGAATGGRVVPIAEVSSAPKEMPIILTAFQITGAQASPAPAAAPASSEQAPAGYTFQGKVAPDVMQAMAKFSELNLQGAIESITNTSNHFDELIGKVNRVLGSGNKPAPQGESPLAGLTANAGKTMDALEKMGNSVNTFVTDPDLRLAVKSLPKMIDDMNKTNRDMKDAIDMARSHLERLDEFTNTLRSEGPDTLVHIHQMAKGLDDLTKQLNNFGDALNGDKGSLGQLLHNPALYENLNGAACNVKDLTVQLQPIIHDARVFSDKIARHPETLGVRGAISPSLGTKGMPSFASPGGFSGSSDDPYQDGRQLRFDRN
jgi:phospholipid/cholesterol/gamma-HCH transport system substrate-binding protein